MRHMQQARLGARSNCADLDEGQDAMVLQEVRGGGAGFQPVIPVREEPGASDGIMGKMPMLLRGQDAHAPSTPKRGNVVPRRVVAGIQLNSRVCCLYGCLISGCAVRRVFTSAPERIAARPRKPPRRLSVPCRFWGVGCSGRSRFLVNGCVRTWACK